MALIGAYLHGIYPRSEELVAATRDLDRGRTTAGAVADRQAQDLADLVALQGEAGMTFTSDGLLTWQDLFRPLVEASQGLALGALVRWFDNNTFYRAPEARGPVGLNGRFPNILATAAAVPEPRVATLPSPYLFSRVMVHGRPNRAMAEVAENVLHPVAQRLAAEGFGLIQLQEPWLAFHGIHEDDWRPFAEAVAVITDGLDATTVLHTYFGDVSRYAGRLQELPVDVIGFDLVETDVSSLGSGWTKGVLMGCVDGRRSVVEPVDEIVALAERVAGQLHPPSIYLSNNSDLELLPRDLAAEKVRRLGQAAGRLNERVKEMAP
jgi:5-methyltetrahydropteroyltriglutamate--homocysteine methyltransferase